MTYVTFARKNNLAMGIMAVKFMISLIATWGPTLYYAAGIANSFIGPYLAVSGKTSPDRMQDRLPDVFKAVDNLRKDIFIYRVSHLPFAAAFGTSFGHAVVLINTDLAKEDNDALNFILKHELAHLHTNDALRASVLGTVTSAVAAFALPYLQSFLPWWAVPISYAIPWLGGREAHALAMVIFEEQADNFAIRHATGKELIAITTFVQGQIEVHKSLHSKYPHIFLSDGDFSWKGGTCHIPLNYRIGTFEDELQRRNISFQHDPTKLQRAEAFHRIACEKFSKVKCD